MKRPLLQKVLLGVLCILLTQKKSIAQSILSEASFGLGASIYQGDLSPHWLGAYNRPGLSFQVSGQKNLFPGFAIRANYAYGSISDNESSYTSGVHQKRNFWFKATINELSAQLVINPQFNNGTEEWGSLRPYFFGGIGVAFLSIERDWSRFNYSFPHWQSWVLPGLAQDSVTALPRSVLSFPVGAGLRYQINDNFAIYGEAVKRILSTEYLDGFSKSANQKERDGFSSIIFGLTFQLFSGNGDWGRYDCPKDVY